MFQLGHWVLYNTLLVRLWWFVGGILSRGITEIAGESASGKTQLCMQLCLTVQLPLQLGGLNGGTFSASSDYLFVPLGLY